MTINHSATELLRKLNDNSLNVLLNHFLEITPIHLHKMLESYYLKDFPTLRTEAHILHFQATSIGAEILSEISSKIELVKTGPSLDSFLHEKVIKAHKEFEAIKSELKTIQN
jgi:HPt (histidine-containing phosphotransfer) domain-containing protein